MILCRDVCLRCRVDLGEVNGPIELFAEQFSIRIELRPAVDDEPKCRPDVADALLARHLT
jgi:hypothetical protein